MDVVFLPFLITFLATLLMPETRVGYRNYFKISETPQNQSKEAYLIAKVQCVN